MIYAEDKIMDLYKNICLGPTEMLILEHLGADVSRASMMWLVEKDRLGKDLDEMTSPPEVIPVKETIGSVNRELSGTNFYHTPAFTLTDILNQIPKEIDFDGSIEYPRFWGNGFNQMAIVSEEHSDVRFSTSQSDPLHAAADMLVWILKNKKG